MIRAFSLFVACATALFATAEQAQASIYIPDGVRNDVSMNEVINDWGWEVIFRSDYSAGGYYSQGSGVLSGGFSISQVFPGVGPEDWVMLAALRDDGSLIFDVLAAGLFKEVTQFTPIVETQTSTTTDTHEFNNVLWYFNDFSMGFAGPGDIVYQAAADKGDIINGILPPERDRLSWHTYATDGRTGYSAPDFVWGGWRSGNNLHLNDATHFDKVVLKLSSQTNPVPEPTSLVVFAISACVAGLGAANRHRREKLRENTA